MKEINPDLKIAEVGTILTERNPVFFFGNHRGEKDIEGEISKRLKPRKKGECSKKLMQFFGNHGVRERIVREIVKIRNRGVG